MVLKVKKHLEPIQKDRISVGRLPLSQMPKLRKRERLKERNSSLSEQSIPEASMRASQQIPHTLVQVFETKALPERYLAADTEKRPHGFRYLKLRK